MIRPGCAVDLPRIAALHTASWRDAYRGLLPDTYLDGPLSAAHRALWAEVPPGAILRVAVTDGDVAGFLLIRPEAPGGPLLDNLHVDPAVRGGGLGAALLLDGARALAAAGGRALWLEVLEGNTRARAFYRRFGGVEGPVFDDRVHGFAVPARRVAWDDLGHIADTRKTARPGGKSA